MIARALRPIPRGWAYGALSAAAGSFVFVSFVIVLSSFDLDLIGGSVPRPPDTFENVAKALFFAGLVLVPVGAVARRLAARTNRLDRGRKTAH